MERRRSHAREAQISRRLRIKAAAIRWHSGVARPRPPPPTESKANLNDSFGCGPGADNGADLKVVRASVGTRGGVGGGGGRGEGWL